MTAIALFDTSLGTCGIAWADAGVRGLHLAGTDRAATRAGLCRRHPGAVEAEPTPAIRAAIGAIARLLQGESVDLSGIELDLRGVPPFDARVYAVARAIPPGRALTYGEVAAKLGEPGAARQVGQALGANPFAIIVPCHRVLAAGGRSGGFSAPGGVATKLRPLAIEGARIGTEPSLFDTP